ncbi:MAG: ATP-grasp domain-containing protein [Planctomycetaceae bacterium]|nr:ATP-grasp domain-containing protein [Planctomycetaceae bacterium]
MVILAGASVRSLAQSVIRSGRLPIGIDLFCDRDLKAVIHQAWEGVSTDHTGGGDRTPFIRNHSRVISHFDQLPAICEDIPRSIPVIWCGGLENHLSILAQLATQRIVLGPSVPLIRELRSRSFLHRLARDAGIHFPLTIASPGGDADDDAGTSQTPPDQVLWIRKPLHSSGGLGIEFASQPVLVETRDSEVPISGSEPDNVNDQSHVTSHVKRPATPRPATPTGSGGQPSHVLQQYVDGVPVSATIVSDGVNAAVIGCTLQFSGLTSVNATGFQYCGNIGPVSLPAVQMARIQKVASTLVQQTGVRGFLGLDFVLQRGNLWLLEINPRITASHETLEASQRLNVADMHIDAMDGILRADCQAPVRTGPPLLKLIIYADRETHIEGSSDEWCRSALQKHMENQARNAPAVASASTKTSVADLPETGTVVAAGTPFCTLLIPCPEIQDRLPPMDSVRTGIESVLLDRRFPVRIEVDDVVLEITERIGKSDSDVNCCP